MPLSESGADRSTTRLTDALLTRRTGGTVGVCCFLDVAAASRLYDDVEKLELKSFFELVLYKFVVEPVGVVVGAD